MNDKIPAVKSSAGRAFNKIIKYVFVILILTGVLTVFIAYNFSKMTGTAETKRLFSPAASGSGTDFSGWPYIEDRLQWGTLEIKFPRGISYAGHDAEGKLIFMTGSDEIAAGVSKTEFYEINSELRAKMIIACAAEFEKLSLKQTDKTYDESVKEPFSEKIIERGAHRKLTNLVCLALLAADTADIEFAAAADIFLLKLIRSFAYYNNRYMSVSGAVAQYLSLKAVSGLSKRLYIDNGDLLSNAAAAEKIRKSLIIRANSSGIFSKADRAVYYLMVLTMKRLKIYNDEYPLTTAFFNMWYGGSFPLESKWFGGVKMLKTSGFAEIKKILSGLEKDLKDNYAPGDRSFSSALSVNPLISHQFRGPIEYEKVYSKLGEGVAVFRLTTLGGLARLFYLKNGRWPDLNSDKEFNKEAGESAIDPMNDERMKFLPMADGSMKFYSVGFNGADLKGDTRENIVMTVPVPSVK
jgi:hypothetical protein